MNKFLMSFLLIVGFLAHKGFSQCTEPSGDQFNVVSLASVTESQQGGASGPVQIAVAEPDRIFIGLMRTGQIRVYTGGNNTSLAGTVDTYFNTEDGLLGLTLDNDFENTGWLYVFASDPSSRGEDRGVNLYRYSVSASNQLSNQKLILKVTRDSDNTHHAAGGIAMSSNGTLVIGTGDNSNPHDSQNGGYAADNTGRPTADAQRTAANSNDLRGKILRIQPIPFPDTENPTPGVGTTYDIPEGNMFSQGQADTRPEIFTMGHRNPYHPRIDSRSGWIFWGEVGPDAGSPSSSGPEGYEEWNLATQSGFFGWPYCVAKNLNYQGYDCNTPSSNNSPNNTGITELPAAIQPQIAYSNRNNDSRFGSSGECAVGGPMYRYDPNLNSDVKFPPYYEGKILYFDWAKRNQSMKFLVPSADATLPSTSSVVRDFSPSGLPNVSWIDAQFGPDGALYLLKFSDNSYNIGGGGQLYRVEYNGSYDNDCYEPFMPTVTGPDAQPVLSIGQRLQKKKTLSPVMASGFVTLPYGYKSVNLYDLTGKKVWSYTRDEDSRPESVRLPEFLSDGIWYAKFLP